MCALVITHLSQGLLVGTPLIGIFIWSLPLIIFGYKSYKALQQSSIKSLDLLF